MGPDNTSLKKPKLTPAPKGPFIYDNPLHPDSGHLHNSRGEKINCVEKVALCRCGGSSNKPFCDGTHASIGFTGEREFDRGTDKRHSYEGKRITIHYNNSICSHAGFCINELPEVFRLGEKPYIDPDTVEPERIIELIEKCPSGALSYSIDGVEHRDLDREPGITVTRDGPYCVVGGIEVVGEEPRAEGVSTEHCTCCRCGASRNKPFCDGSHSLVGFEDDTN